MRAILITIVAAAALVGVALVLGPVEQTAEGQRAIGPEAKPAAIAVAAAPALEPQPEPELIEERIFDLPEDGLVWFTTICYPENRYSDPASRKIAAWFASDPRLASLARQTRFKEVSPGDKLYESHTHGHPGTLPFIWVQRANGNPIFKTSADKLPESGKALADLIALKIAEQCPCKPHRPNQPGPRPNQPYSPPVQPTPPDDGPRPPVDPNDPSVEPIPDMGPEEEPAGEPLELPPWAYGAIPLGAVLLALLVGTATRKN